jgi:hypothetical protein
MSRADLHSRGLVFLSVCALIGLPPLLGQTATTGDVTGVVRDSSEAAVGNSLVTLREIQTGAERTATTGPEGFYRFTFIKPGEYDISAAAAQLKSNVARIAVLVGQTRTVNLTASIAEIRQAVEVIDVAPLVDAQSPNLVAAFTTHDIQNMPMPGGDITSIAFATPGVAMSTGGGWGNFSVHGLPGTSNLFTINGNDYNDAYLNLNYSGASNLLLGGNEIQEATIVLNAYTVQYGRQAGAQINYVTRSGGNGFHGNLLWNWNGNALNANTFFNNANGVQRPRAVSNQYGASLGGPIRKNKLFFFANTEGIRYALPAGGYVAIPSPQLQRYILNNVTGAQAPLYQGAFRYWNAAPGASGAIPVTNGAGSLQDTSNRLGCGDLAGTPAPGGGTFGTNVPCAAAWVTNGSNVNTEWLVSLRGDYNLSDTQRLYIRFKEDHGLQPTATSLIDPIFNAQSLQPLYEGQVSHTWTISRTVVNNIIASANWCSFFFDSPDLKASVAAFPVNFFITDGGSNSSLGFTQMGLGARGWGFQLFPQGRNMGQWQIADDLSKLAGRHTLKFGINFRKNRITDSSLLEGIHGQYNFSSLTDFATGQLRNGSNYAQSFPVINAAHIRYYSLGLYAQDERTLGPNLKITYGVRMQRNANPSCIDNCFARLAGEFSSPDFRKGSAIPYNQSIQTGLANAYPHTDAAVFEPRGGVVWSPRNRMGTVIRAGAGMFTDLPASAIVSQLFTNAPNSFSAPILSGSVNTSNDATSAAASALAGAQAFRSGFSRGHTFDQLNLALQPIGGFNPPGFFSTANQLRTPKYLQWSFEIQQPVGAKNVLDLTYVGNHGRDLPRIDPTVNGFGFGPLPAAAPDPRFSGVYEMASTGMSNYHGLTVAWRRALAFGFKGEIGYTFSHSLDDLSSQLGEPYNATASNLSQVLLNTPFGPRANYSNSDYDIRHNLTADFIWDPKLRPTPKSLRPILSGWILTSRFFLRSGVPFSVFDFDQAIGLLGNNIASQNFNGFLATATSPVSGICGAAAVNTPCITTSQFVDSGSETSFGNLRRNSFRGPGYFNWDAAIYKAFSIRERSTVSIGASAYNLTNHANFDVPSGNLSAPGLGLISNTVSAPTSAYGAFQGAAVSGRILVLAAKFQF